MGEIEWRGCLRNHSLEAVHLAAPARGLSHEGSIRDGDWKLLMNPDASRVELYNIPADPGEMDNLAKTMPEITKKMTLAALAWQKTPPVGPVEPSVGRNDRKWPT